MSAVSDPLRHAADGFLDGWQRNIYKQDVPANTQRMFNNDLVLVTSQDGLDDKMTLSGFNAGSYCGVALVCCQPVRNLLVQIGAFAENRPCDRIGIDDLYGFGAR